MTTLNVSNSSSVKRVDFEEPEEGDTGTLTITYTNNRSYCYDRVPVSVFETVLSVFEEGASIGSAINKLVVRGGFSYEEVTE